MIEFALLVIAYFAFLIALGIYVANRTFGPVILFFTLAATNFSAFTFLGFAGKAYDSGFGQYGIMGFGTAIMAIMFYVIGRKVWKLGKEKGYITPPELIGDRFNSTGLRLLFMGVMVVFTIPYLATQAIGAGMIIERHKCCSRLANWCNIHYVCNNDLCFVWRDERIWMDRCYTGSHNDFCNDSCSSIYSY